ncbi:MAG: hypothetical protein ABI137_13215 [Antricoccus sp.]
MQTSLGDLAGLVTGSLGLPELLQRVATFAAHAIPGADVAACIVDEAVRRARSRHTTS